MATDFFNIDSKEQNSDAFDTVVDCEYIYGDFVTYSPSDSKPISPGLIPRYKEKLAKPIKDNLYFVESVYREYNNAVGDFVIVYVLRSFDNKKLIQRTIAVEQEIKYYTDRMRILLAVAVHKRWALESVNKKKGKTLSSLGDADSEKERQKRKKIHDLMLNTFRTVNDLDRNYTKVKAGELKVGNIVVSFHWNEPCMLYEKVTEISQDDRGYLIRKVDCDRLGVPLLKDSASGYSYKPESEFHIIESLPKPPKAKVAFHATIEGEKFDIYSNTDDTIQQISKTPSFCRGKMAYFVVVGHGRYGMVRYPDIYSPDTDKERLSEIVADKAGVRDAVHRYPKLTLFPDKAGKAANVRMVLKEHFPKTKFSIRTTYDKCEISWIDGPTHDEVLKYAGLFQDEWDGDYMSDYHSYKSTPFTFIFGGYDYLDNYLHRSYSDGQKRRMWANYPELRSQGISATDFQQKYPNFKQEISDEYGYHGDFPTLNSSHSYNYYRSYIDEATILADIPLPDYIPEATPKPKLSPLEKTIKEAVGSGNMIALWRGSYLLCQKPSAVKYSYFYPVSYSQPSVRNKVMERLQAAGFQTDPTTRYGSGSIKIYNYPTMMQKVAEERKRLKLPTRYNPWILEVVTYLRHKLQNHNIGKAQNINKSQK